MNRRILHPWSAQARAARTGRVPASPKSTRSERMRWRERKTQIRAMYGEAITVALMWGGLAVLVLAARAQAQKEPLMLPTTHVTVPQKAYSPGEGAKVKGLIISRNGDDMVIRDETGYLDVVTLTADTKISSPSGIFKTEKKRRDVT